MQTAPRSQLSRAPQRRRGAGSSFEPGQIKHRAFSYYAPLHRVATYLEEHISDPLSLKQAADLAGLERSYFSSFFHRKSGVRFCEWTAYIRVQRAKALLRTLNRSITHVCFEVGYRDLRTFQRNFRRYAGMTAGEFKRLEGPK
jgi:AraC-like DNA-binding protein